MARSTSTNYSSPSFPIATADGDDFDAADVQQLAAAVEAHDHTTGKGVVITPGSSGASAKFSETVLSSTQSSVTFSSIPGTYRNIRITWQARGDTAATSVNVRLRCNGDTAANYDGQEVYGNNTSAGGSVEMGGSGGARIGGCAAASAPSGAVGIGEVILPNYSGTIFWKSGSNRGMNQGSTSAGGVTAQVWAFTWRSTAAVTSITLLPTAGDFIAGSTFTLYLEP